MTFAFRRLPLLVLSCLGLALATACAANPARLPVVDPGTDPGQTQTVFVATTRAPVADPMLRFGAGRSSELAFARAEVWVPHNREPGAIEPPGRTPDPGREFALADWELLPGQAVFSEQLDESLNAVAFPERDVFLFVHGFNTPFSDGLYLNAQILNDFGILGTAVHYSWPSAGRIPAYLYDRDSAQFARDGLAETLTLLAESETTSITILAHSMGSLVTMEALRQLSLSGRHDVLERIDPVILASPDIDLDLFRSQLDAIDPPPAHLAVFVSRRDRVLLLSDQLRGGQRTQLGMGAQRDVLTGLGVTVVDLSDIRDGGFTHHRTFASSPTLMRLAASGMLNAALMGEAGKPRASGIGTLSDLAASIIYLPARALGER
jgi:esterase/lipase superfamily enzyme